MSIRNAKGYVLNALPNKCHDGHTLPSNKAKLAWFKKTFLLEYGHNLKKAHVEDVLQGYLSGLPSSINIPYLPEDIHRDIAAMGMPKPKSKEEYTMVVEGWFSFLAALIIDLWDEHNLANDLNTCHERCSFCGHSALVVGLLAASTQARICLSCASLAQEDLISQRDELTKETNKEGMH